MTDMSKQTEALKLALEFIDNLHKPGWGNQERQQAITALREALAREALDRMAENARELGLDYEPVWGSGPTNKDYEDSMRQKRLHQLTSPTAQRTWVALTDEDIRKCSKDVADQGPEDCVDRFAYAIEAKLKEKNTSLRSKHDQ